MGHIFKNPFFIITLAATVLISALSLVMRINGKMSFADDAVSALMLPFEKASRSIGDFFGNIGQYFRDYDSLKKENEELKMRIKDMSAAVDNADKLRRENEWLYDFLDLKRKNTSYELCEASVISYSQIDYLANFTVDRGSSAGIKKGMAVITEDGLLGCITQVGATTSVCTATVNPNFSVGVYTERIDGEGEEQSVSETGESLIATGNFADASSSYMRISHLPETASVASGDIVRTAGSDIYPRGLFIGTVVSVEADEFSQSMYALVDTGTDINSVSRVMIIKSFTEESEETAEAE